MGIFSNLFSTGGLVSGGLSKLSQWKWIFLIVIVLAVIFGFIYWLRMAKNKKTQWTHTIKVRRLLQNGTLTVEVIHNARRFPLEKGVEMFELEKPILGSYLIPQPGEYTGGNEFSIILDSYNRIWENKGVSFDKHTQSVHVSGVHAGIDVQMANSKDKWQQAHKVNKKITTAELIKAGLKALGIIAVVILGIMAIQQWGDAQQYKAQSEQAQADAMIQINEATKTMKSVVNTQQLMIIPMLEALYGDENIQSQINKYRGDYEIEEI